MLSFNPRLREDVQGRTQIFIAESCPYRNKKQTNKQKQHPSHFQDEKQSEKTHLLQRKPFRKEIRF